MIRYRHWGTSLAFLLGALATAELSGRGLAQDKAPAWKLDTAFEQTWVSTVTQVISEKDGAKATIARTVTTKLSWVPKKPAEGSKDREFDVVVTSIAVETKAGKDAADGAPLSFKSDGPPRANDLAKALRNLHNLKFAVKFTPEESGTKIEVGGVKEAVGALPEAEQKAVKVFVTPEVVERTIRAAFPDLKKDAPAAKGEFKTDAGSYKSETAWALKGKDEKKPTYDGKATWTFKAAEAEKPAVKVPDHKVELTGKLTFNVETGLAEDITLTTAEGAEPVKVTVTQGEKSTEVTVKTSYSQTITTTPVKKE